ncbi:MAG TPA: diguanylate cyclase [Edaphobacter sp.]
MDSYDQSGQPQIEDWGRLASLISWLSGIVDSTLGVVLIYLAVTMAGVGFGAYIAHSNVIWPANGVLLGILLFSRRKKWAQFLIWTSVTNAILHMFTGFNPGRSLIYSLANIAEVYPAALFIRWGDDRRPDLSRSKVLIRFLIAAMITPTFSAAVVQCGTFFVNYGLQYDGIRSWYLADVLGLIIMTPLVLAVRRIKLQRLFQEKPSETLTIWGITALAGYLISRQTTYPIFFCFFPLLLLAVFRLGLTGSAISIILISLPADYFTVQRRGPFSLSGNSAVSPVHLLQFYLMTMIATAYAGAAALAENERLRLSLAESHEKMETLAGTDALTGLANRRTFDIRIQDEWKRAIREKTPLSLLMVDVDYFKAYNDRYGHPAGDRLLKDIANAMASLPHRAMDLVCRYGGEEFAILLPNTHTEGAMLFAERMREKIANLRREDQDGTLPSITISVGLSTIRPRDTVTFFDEFLVTADKALYDAKTAGRNQVKVRLIETEIEQVTE